MHTLFHLTGICIILLIGVSCDFYIAHRLVAPRYNKRGTAIYMLLHTIVLITLTITGCIATFGGLEECIPMLVWVMYGFMLMYIPKLTYSIVSCIDYLKKPRGKWGHYIGLALAATSIVVIIGSTINRYRLDVKECQIVSDRLPESFDNYRIVHFSDMHLETLYSHRYAQQVVDCINSLQPDIIIFSGDIVNRKATELQGYKPELEQLNAKDGIFSVMGNHDYGDFVNWASSEARQANLNRLHDIQASMGWRMLNNASMFIHRGNDSIAIIGVENWGEPPFQQYGDLALAYPNLYDENFKILISHNSRHWHAEVLPKSNIDLTLSGHTHAMQMKIGNLSPAVLRYPEWGGIYQEGNRYLYVNIGIGCTMTPTRLGATPEITLITLKTTH